MVLALAFAVIGVVAFVHPGNTFDALAAVLSFYFILKGALNVGLSPSPSGAGTTSGGSSC